jgi:hypothetical protein
MGYQDIILESSMASRASRSIGRRPCMPFVNRCVSQVARLFGRSGEDHQAPQYRAEFLCVPCIRGARDDLWDAD